MRILPLVMTTVLAAACGKDAAPTDANPTAAAGADASAPPSNDPRAAILAEIPEPLRGDAGVTDAVKALAGSLPSDLAGLANAVATAPSLSARPFPADAPNAPYSPDAVAQAITAKLPLKVSTYERARLVVAIVQSRGTAAELGYVAGARFSATEILGRRFVVKTADGAWTAVDGTALDGAAAEKVRPLDAIDVQAQDLAFRALGAMAAENSDLASRASGLARRLRPDDAAILFVAARAELQNGLVEAASDTMDKAADLEADAMTWYALGRQARLEERPFKADEYFRKAAQADPSFAEPHIGLANLALDRMDLTPADQHPALVDAAKKAVADARAADPKARGLRLVEAQIKGIDEDYAGAEALLKEETELNPDDEQAWVTLAQVMAAQQRVDEAVKTLETARKAGIETTEVLNSLGALYVQQKNFDAAQSALEAALEKDPKDPDVRAQIAQLRLQKGDLDGAKKLLEAQIAKFPDELNGFLLLAQVELEQGKVDEALGYVDQVLKKDPKHREARILSYLARVATGKPADDARAGAIEAAGSRKNLAQMFLQNGLVADAEKLLVEALETDKEDVIVPVLLAAIYVSTGRVAEADALREKTLAPLKDHDRTEIEKLFADAFAQAAKGKQGPGAPEPGPTPPGP
ncbi:MAG: tetratricopeptide repeat protein [Myxococcota bacterium]